MTSRGGSILTGGCFCGRLRYEIRGTPFNATICHCGDCRRISGAPVVAWFSVQSADFALVAGTLSKFASSDQVIRSFCGTCGAPLTYQRSDLPNEVDVTTASLDDPLDVPPLDQTHVRQRLAWVETIGSLPGHFGGRPLAPIR